MAGTSGRHGAIDVIGEVMTDVVVAHDGPVVPAGDTPARTRILQGGAGANVAHHLAARGVPVVFHGAVGDDVFGREAVRVLRDAGVSCRVAVHDRAATGTCVILVDRDGERTMFPDRGANALLAVPEVDPGAAHLHVSGYVLHAPSTRETARRSLAAAREAGVATSVDAASAGPLREMGAGAFLDAVRGVDLLVVTRDEAAVLTGTSDAGAAAEALAACAREVVVKRGAGGALHRAAGGAVTEVPAVVPDGPVVDTTGAGDALMAALIALRAAGADPARALRGAVAAGAAAVTVRGARPV